MVSDGTTVLCKVCLEATEAHTEAICSSCGDTFHLNSRADLPGKDCGDVWINEEHQALQFACNVCLRPETPELQMDDIVDLAEAVRLSGVSEELILSAFERGTVRGKRLGGGVVILQRQDVMELSASRS